VTVITQEDMATSNAKTITDVLESEVGVVVRNLSGTARVPGGYQGVWRNRPLNTLVLVDGRRVNEIDLSGVDWTQIPLIR